MVATRQSWEVASTTDVTLPTTAETVILTVRNVNASLGRILFDFDGHASVTTGAGATSVVTRVRRGTVIMGTLVGDASIITLGAAVQSPLRIVVTDTLEGAAGQSYVLTVQQTGATGNGAVTQAALRCDSRSG